MSIGFPALLSIYVGQATGKLPNTIQERESLWNATEPDPNTGEFNPVKVNGVLKTIPAAKALGMLNDRETFKDRGDAIRHETVLNALRFRTTGMNESEAAELGYRAGLQGLSVPREGDQQIAMPGGIHTAKLKGVTDFLVRSEESEHWQENVSKYAPWISGMSGIYANGEQYAKKQGKLKTAAIMGFYKRGKWTTPHAAAEFNRTTPYQQAQNMLGLIANHAAENDLGGLADALDNTANELAKWSRDTKVDLVVDMDEYRARMGTHGDLFGIAPIVEAKQTYRDLQADSAEVRRVASQARATADWMKMVAVAVREVITDYPDLAAARAAEAAPVARPDVEYDDPNRTLSDFYKETGFYEYSKQFREQGKEIRQVLPAMDEGPEKQRHIATVRYAAAMIQQLEDIANENRRRMAQAYADGADTVNLIPPFARRDEVNMDQWQGERPVSLGTTQAARPAPPAEPVPPALPTGDEARRTADAERAAIQKTVEGTKYKTPGEAELYGGLAQAKDLTSPGAANAPNWTAIGSAIKMAATGDAKLKGTGGKSPPVPSEAESKKAMGVVLAALGFTPTMLGVTKLEDFTLDGFNAIKVKSKEKLVAQMPGTGAMATGLHKLLQSPNMGGISPAAMSHVINDVVIYGLLWSIKTREGTAKPTQPGGSAVPPRPTGAVPPPQPSASSQVLQEISLGSADTEDDLIATAESVLRANAGKAMPAEVMKSHDGKTVIDGDSVVMGVCGYDSDGNEYCVPMHVRLAGVSAVEHNTKKGPEATAFLASMLEGFIDTSMQLNPKQPMAAYNRWSGVIYGQKSDNSIVRVNVELMAKGERNEGGFNRQYGAKYDMPASAELSPEAIDVSLGGAGNRDYLYGEEKRYDWRDLEISERPRTAVRATGRKKN